MKTIGQQVYEHYHPSHIRVVPVGRVSFATAEDVLTVPNPVYQAPYHLLTQTARDYWEQYAVGHHIVSQGK
jgi:hypothetical protein